MKILVINAGSSSLKYQLYQMRDEAVLAAGRVERIGMTDSIVVHEPYHAEETTEISEILDHTTAIRKVLDKLIDVQHGVVKSIVEIEAVGHRVVHGGESFRQSVLVNADVKAEICRLFALAPLHNPAHMMGIQAVEINLPHVPQAVVFDTAFHQTMPPTAYMYAIPKILYQKHKIRRYGFHGTSHHYVSQRAAEIMNRPLQQLKLISCHIGNGGSLAAIVGGQSVDTSMGMTPLEGLMMGTRSGDLDPAIVPFTMMKENLSVHEVNSMLNKHSGLLAVSDLSSDMREITDAMAAGEPHATLAFQMYVYRLRKYIGAYVAAMDGVDAIIFTAGVGENSSIVREEVCKNLTYFGVEMNQAENNIRSKEPRVISTANSKVQVLVIPTNEERMIARDTFRLVQANMQS